ncbi:MAG TPA: hypothetical protein PKY81_16475 [bacterium]|nr:hypothetical protein [bacterium]
MIILSVKGSYSRLPQSAHLTAGLKQISGLPRFAHTGEYPDLFALIHSQRSGYTSSRPLNIERNKAIFVSGGEFLLILSEVCV